MKKIFIRDHSIQAVLHNKNITIFFRLIFDLNIYRQH